MRKIDYDEIRGIKGKTIKDILVNLNEEDDYGFEIIFDYNSRLEIYDIKCLAIDDCDMIGKMQKLTEYSSGKIVYDRYSKKELGGGYAWGVVKKSELCDE